MQYLPGRLHDTGEFPIAMETHTEIDASEETNTPMNEPVAVNSAPEDMASIASQSSSGGASGSAHVHDRASDNSSDFRYASISDDNTSQHVAQEMTDMCDAGSDTTKSETEELESGSGSRCRSRRCLPILGVFLLIFIALMIVLGIGLSIAYAVLGEEILHPITYLENTIDEEGESLSSIFR